jgi:SAM-dependent methyltransferase
MSDWSAGYVADIGYTFGYYTELNPLRIKLAFLNNGLVYPEVGTACELGFGQGLSTNIHAAASVTKWYGTDFNPAQAAYARDLAEKSGADATLYDDSFAEFLSREDLPEFDYIGLHGIWSWVSDENRSIIVEFIRRKLKVGGVVYISYNTLPGWAAFAPMRHLMTEHAEVIGSEGRGIVSRINDAIEFADKLLKTNPVFSRANPLVGERIKKLKDQNRHYLAHEYFNRDWHPMHFSTMAAWLEPAKLQYACSAHYIEQIDAVNLSEEQQEFMKEIPDPMFRQSVFDFMVNQQFRRDYWVKGLRRLTGLEQSEALGAQKVILVSHRPNVSLKVTGALGEADMSAEIYTPILDLLADHKARTLAQIFHTLKPQNITFAHVVQAAMILAGGGHLASVQEESIVNKAKRQTERLNSQLMNTSRAKGDVSFVASPVTGGGVLVTRIQQLFVLAMIKGKKTPAEWAESAWETLCLQGEKLIKAGVMLEVPEDNLAELTRQAQDFADEQVAILKTLQII